MSKIKCKAHGRRIYIFGDKFVHRSDIGDGNGTRCDSVAAKVGTQNIVPLERLNA